MYCFYLTQAHLCLQLTSRRQVEDRRAPIYSRDTYWVLGALGFFNWWCFLWQCHVEAHVCSQYQGIIIISIMTSTSGFQIHSGKRQFVRMSYTLSVCKSIRSGSWSRVEITNTIHSSIANYICACSRGMGEHIFCPHHMGKSSDQCFSCSLMQHSILGAVPWKFDMMFCKPRTRRSRTFFGICGCRFDVLKAILMQI